MCHIGHLFIFSSFYKKLIDSLAKSLMKYDGFVAPCMRAPDRKDRALKT